MESYWSRKQSSNCIFCFFKIKTITTIGEEASNAASNSVSFATNCDKMHTSLVRRESRRFRFKGHRLHHCELLYGTRTVLLRNFVGPKQNEHSDGLGETMQCPGPLLRTKNKAPGRMYLRTSRVRNTVRTHRTAPHYLVNPLFPCRPRASANETPARGNSLAWVP